MGKRKSLLFLILAVSLLMVGCLGGGKLSKEKEINKLLADVSAAYKSNNPDTLVDLWAYPVEIKGSDETYDRLFLRQCAVWYFERWEESGDDRQEVEIVAGEGGFDYSISGDAAIVSNAVLRLIYLNEENNLEIPMGDFKVIKAGDRWKFKDNNRALDLITAG